MRLHGATDKSYLITAIRVSGALLPEIPTEEIAVGSIREKVALVIP